MRAAFYECEVTPPLGGFIWGHYAPIRAYDVVDRLYVKALVVEDGGELAAIVAIDSCALPPQMHDIVTKRITEFTGISADRVCIASNHTHWGAPISDDPTVGCEADRTYQDVFFRLTADAVILAYRRLAEVTATYGTETVPGIAFCRDYLLADGTARTFGPTPNTVGTLSVPDESLSVLSFYQDGEPIGALIDFACHQCCASGNGDGYTGDYSSILAKELKKKYGPDFVSVFVPGACGDVNHHSPDRSGPQSPDHYRMMGRKIAEKAILAMEKAESVPGGVSAVKKPITLNRRQATPAYAQAWLADRSPSKVNLMRTRNLVYYQVTNKEETATLWLQVIRIGDIAIYCMPGEIFVDHGYRLKAESTANRVMVVENCNSYCGYIPTKKAFSEGYDLYETTLCHHSCMEEDAGDKMVDALLMM